MSRAKDSVYVCPSREYETEGTESETRKTRNIFVD